MRALVAHSRAAMLLQSCVGCSLGAESTCRARAAQWWCVACAHLTRRKVVALCLAATLLLYLYPHTPPATAVFMQHADNVHRTQLRLQHVNISIGSHVELQLTGRDGQHKQAVHIGTSVVRPYTHSITAHTADALAISFEGGVTLRLSHSGEGGVDCYRVQWERSGGEGVLQDLFTLAGAHWYGGAALFTPPWPLESDVRASAAYVTGDSYRGVYGGVLERYWLSSNGVALYVDYDVPLYVGMNESGSGRLSLLARFAQPYGNSAGANLSLKYSLCVARDVRAMYLASPGRFWKKPVGAPDHRAFRDPIWSTWATFKNGIDHKKVIEFARDINAHKFNNSHLLIDDGWQTHYGDFDFHPTKFPDPQGLMQELKQDLGFRVMLWVHPYASIRSNILWRRDSSGRCFFIPWGAVDYPALLFWWNGAGAALDLTNTQAVDWYFAQLSHLKNTIGVDSFKFDGGESSWLSSYGQTLVPMDNPSEYSRIFVDIAAGGRGSTPRIQEVRVGVKTQEHAMFLRLMDKDSTWGRNNGLGAVIPTMLLYGLLGYPYAIPDMIGGNAYHPVLVLHATVWPERELYVRWLQMNALMPVMQFSVLPWHYDDEVRESLTPF